MADMQVGLSGGQFNVHEEPQANPGSCFYDNKNGKIWVYMKANVALKQGEAVTIQTLWGGALDDVFDAASAGSIYLKRASGGTTNLATNLPGLQNDYEYKERPIIYAYSGTGHGQMGVIVEVLEDRFEVEWLTSDDGKLKTATAATTDFHVYAPYLAIKATDEVQGVVGFPQVIAIAKDEYFWALHKGNGIGRRIKGTTAGIAHGAGLQASDTTAGLLEGLSGDTHTEAVAFSMTAVAINDATIDLIPIVARGNMLPGTIPLGERWG